MGPVCKKVRVMSQLTIEEELEEEVMGEAVVTEEAEAAGEPAVEVVVGEDMTMQDATMQYVTMQDVTMQDAPGVVLLAKVGPSVEETRMTPMDTIKALLGVRSDGTIHGYLQLSLVEITWQNLQETRKLHKSLNCWEKLEQMIICRLDTLVGQGHAQYHAS